ncbi:MAG: T9SS type A sorting domain-containing protein [Bacteroidota bacterium]
MQKVTLLLLALSGYSFLYGQGFQEICSDTPFNGTMVNCNYYQDTLYATGFFNTICGESVGYIAKWEENEWRPSSVNITDPGHAMRTIGDKLYIARYEESIDSNWVYVYGNGTLSKLGEGIYLTTASGLSELPNIYDIIEYNGKIIACGEFDRVGSANIQGIMEWDGNSWGPLGTGLSEGIDGSFPVLFPHQLLVHDGELYVTGNFKFAGGVEVNGIGKWDGTEWTALGDGFNGTVYSLIVYNGALIAGGSFTESGGTPVNRIAKWNGTSWESLDFGFTPSSGYDFTFVHTMKVIDDELYMGGGLQQITYADNTTEVCNGIVRYDGNTLDTFMGGVPNNDIEAICQLPNGQLIVGGGVFGTGYSGIYVTETNTSELVSTAEVRLSPNPFTHSLQIESQLEIVSYQLVDQRGVVVQSGAFESALSLEVPPGLYFLRLIAKDLSFSIHKVIRTIE